MGMSFYRHCIRPNLHLSSSTSPRCLLGSHRRLPMLHLWMRWKCLMPLVTHLLDEWGDIQFLFSNFSMDAVPMGEIPQQSFYRLHDLDVPFCRCILGVGHVVGRAWWMVVSCEIIWKTCFCRLYWWACHFIDIAFGQIYTCLPRLLLGASWGDSGECWCWSSTGRAWCHLQCMWLIHGVMFWFLWWVHGGHVRFCRFLDALWISMDAYGILCMY